MKLNKLYIIAAAVCVTALSGCKNDDIYAADFDSKVYLSSTQRVSTVLVKKGMSDLTRSLQVESAKLVTKQVTIKFQIDETLVDTYNRAYYDNAVLLPAENYEMPVVEAVMSANSSQSTAVDVNFKALDQLDRETHYVLPVTIASIEGADVLESARRQYFVFKGSALINVVGDVDENFLTINWKNKAVVNNLRTFTIEGLLRARNFDKMISTFCGIEGEFLLRFGDMGFPAGQLQVATSEGNWPDADPTKALPTNKWVHVAFTYSNGAMKIYIDGKLQSEGTKNLGSVNLGVNDFYIGKSYDNNRSWAGEMSEVRIWNVARTKEQIANNIYFVDPATPGLVSYWKFDEGAGSFVKDYTSNVNNAMAKSPMKWTTVSLPESGK